MMIKIKARIAWLIVVISASVFVNGCISAEWYASHEIAPEDYSSEQSVNGYMKILAGNNLPDQVKVSQITKNMQMKNDRLAEMLFEKSTQLNNDLFLVNATAYFMNNEYYDYALQAISRGLRSYRIRTRVWFSRQSGNIALKTDASALLPLLKEMAIPGHDKRDVQAYVRKAIRIIEHSRHPMEENEEGNASVGAS